MAPDEYQRWLRIRLSVAAWAYEVHDTSIMSDHEYDRLSLLVDPKVSTGNRKLDTFFRQHFDPSTGVWVLKHPETGKLDQLFRKYHQRGP